MRVILESGAPMEKVVIPQAALIADQEGVYVFVADDGRAAVRRVKPGEEMRDHLLELRPLGPFTVRKTRAGDYVVVHGEDLIGQFPREHDAVNFATMRNDGVIPLPELIESGSLR